MRLNPWSYCAFNPPEKNRHIQQEPSLNTHTLELIRHTASLEVGTQQKEIPGTQELSRDTEPSVSDTISIKSSRK